MFSIGQLSKRTGVKAPTIRYYETVGLIAAPERTEGNQRRYGQSELDTLQFIRHARQLGFSIEAISSLVDLQNTPNRSCQQATEIAQTQLAEVRAKIRQLRALEQELGRIVDECAGDGTAADCDTLAALADHGQCDGAH